MKRTMKRYCSICSEEVFEFVAQKNGNLIKKCSGGRYNYINGKGYAHTRCIEAEAHANTR